jgi:hypothetical protein
MRLLLLTAVLRALCMYVFSMWWLHALGCFCLSLHVSWYCPMAFVSYFSVWLLPAGVIFVCKSELMFEFGLILFLRQTVKPQK